MENTIVHFQSSTRRWLLGSGAGLLALLTSPILIGLVWIAQKWLKNVSTRFVLTDQRLVIKSGIFVIREDEIELYRVKDIVAEYSLLNKWQHIATLVILSSDRTTEGREYRITDVPEGIAIREQIRLLVQEQQRLRRVRAVDVDIDHG